MCGKFRQGFDISYLAALLKLPGTPAAPAAQATPGRPALALVPAAGSVAAQTMRWGFASAPGLGVRPVINARAETMRDKQMFAHASRHARCALPVSAYLEGSTEVSIAGIPVFYLAGLYQRGADDMTEFTVITRAPVPDLSSVEDRMPLVLADKITLERWLSQAEQPAHFPAFTSAAAAPVSADARQMSLF